MKRCRIAASLVLAALALTSCSSGSSPTEPDPPPDTLAGTWQGEISGTVGGAAFTCPLETSLQDVGDGVFLGSWTADCPDGLVAGPLSATTLVDFVVIIALRSGAATPAHPLGVCGWSGPTSLSGSELRGDWEPPDNCSDQSLGGGPLSLRFAG